MTFYKTYAEWGDPTSPICILAEAPGGTEIRIGEPLIGPSGQIFEECLHHAGLVRRQCYILNTWPIRVSKDQHGRIFDPRNNTMLHNGKSFTSEGLELAEPTVKKLRACGANVVVALGAIASELLGETRSITKMRGSILFSEVIGKKFIPTFHPAFILRGNFLSKYPTINDFIRVKQEMAYRDLRLPERSLITAPTFSEAQEYLRDIIAGNHPRIAEDIEVTRGDISCLAIATSPKFSMSIAFIDEDGRPFFPLDQEAELWRLIGEINANPAISKIGQNFIFDMAFMWTKKAVWTRGRILDTMVAHHIIYPDFPKGLDFLCSMHTREPYYKDEGKIWKHPFRDMESFWRYNCKDSAITFEVWNAIEPELHEKGHWRTYERTVRIYEPLLYMMRRGLKVNMADLALTKESVRGEIEKKTTELKNVADYEFNPRSSKQVMEYFYIHKGIKPYVSRTSGKPTSDDKAMARIVRRYNFPEARLVQEIRRLNKLDGTYLEIQFDPDNRLRTSYNPRGTKYGRLSSSETIFGTGTNMQNLHPGFKGFLISDRERKSNG